MLINIKVVNHFLGQGSKFSWTRQTGLLKHNFLFLTLDAFCWAFAVGKKWYLKGRGMVFVGFEAVNFHLVGAIKHSLIWIFRRQGNKDEGDDLGFKTLQMFGRFFLEERKNLLRPLFSKEQYYKIHSYTI